VPRFVLLEHDWPTHHFDLMLEAGDVLRTWRLQDRPKPNQTVNAERIGDHRLVYLEYEGPVSGSRGSVVRVDAGEYDVVEETRSRLIVKLHGQQMITQIELRWSDHNANKP
jgi:hypothetical protein